jgi:hypothetical protein
LPEDGCIYKAQDFDFTYSEDFKLDEDGEPVDPKAFDARMEIMN